MAAPALRNEEAALVLAVDAFAQGRFVEVSRALAGRNYQPSQRIFADHLAAYGLLGQNKSNEAIDLALRVTGIPVLDKATLMSRAMILNGAGRGSEAAILFQSALDTNVAWPVGVRAYGDWLLANNRKADAVAMYQRLVRAGGIEAGGFAASLSMVQSGQLSRSNQDLRAIAAAGLVTIAQSLAADGRGGTPVTLFNLIAYLDPRSDAVAIVLADQLISESRSSLAKPILMRIRPSSPDYLAARTELVWLVFSDDQAAAVALARETLRLLPNNVAASRLLADVLAANRDDQEAEALYSILIDKSIAADQDESESWPLYFGRGGARERQGNWVGALSDLRFAKTAAPNQPSVLNYLGYAMADRGENIDEALAMLRTAVRLRPRSGSILDSLGWALFRAGRYEEAVSTLEAASSMSPALAEITDHLGDAYWRTGREDEARMEWTRTLRLETTAKQRESVAAKLRDGLPPETAGATSLTITAQPSATTQR
jgi:Flp pilus assembly protein TadD